MSFFGKFRGGSGSSSQGTSATPAKKDPNAPQPTKLEKHLKDVSGPVRLDGSDKFFGFENYGSTCYSNSIIQCLYYSVPFRSHVINFPPKEYIQSIPTTEADGSPLLPRSTSSIPWPNVSSPARKQPPAPGSPAAQGKPEETKDSPEYLKRMAIQSGPVLDMIHDSSNKYGMEESLFTALKDIFDSVISNESRKGVVSPHKFLEILRRENEMFRSAMHQDAHEFLNKLLNAVVENVEAFSKQHPVPNGVQANGAAPEKQIDGAIPTNGALAETKTNGVDTRWVHDLFEGLLTSETRCLTCENLSQRDEPFLDLSVDLAAHTSVTSCLRKFSEEEMLCERNKFHCDNCGGLQEAEKRMKIKRLPRVLALHLKRFKYTEDLQRLHKLFHRVVYPFHLRLFNTTDDAEDADRLYELYAVVVHIGGGPYHGHYVSIIKTQDRGWLLFDDELVEPVDKSYVLNFFGGEPVPGVQDAKQLACAYILFYQETTLEAVLREQEMEGQEPVDSQVSDVDGANDGSILPSKHTANATVASPAAADVDGMDGLARAVTSPIVASPTEAPLEPTHTLPAAPPAPVKSKKERKAKEKEQRAAARAEEKALQEKRNEASARRIEAWKKQDEQLKAALEASKQSATEEAVSRGEKPKGGGLSRFRSGSMSLRSKPKFFSGKDKESSTEKLTSVPQETGESNPLTTDHGSTVDTKSPMPETAGFSRPLSEVHSPVAASSEIKSPMSTTAEVQLPEEKRKRSLFGLGKKRSQGLS